MKEILMYQTSDGNVFISKTEAKAHENELEPEKEWDIEIYYEGSYCTIVSAKTREEAIEFAREEAYSMSIDFEEVDVHASEI